jgi:hypothetical protein
MQDLIPSELGAHKLQLAVLKDAERTGFCMRREIFCIIQLRL